MKPGLFFGFYVSPIGHSFSRIYSDKSPNFGREQFPVDFRKKTHTMHILLVG